MHNIVFLDRDSLIAAIRPPAFPHQWQDYGATAHTQVVERLADASIAITNKVPVRAADLERLPKLKMIAIAATGGDNVDLDACRARGIVVSNIRNYSLVSVPEHCFGLMLALRRNLRRYTDDVAHGRWQQSTRFCLLDHPIGDLAGSTLGLVGYGALGKRVAQIALAFGMRVLVTNRSPVADPQVRQVELEALLRESDVVSLHVPLTADTRGMIGAGQLAQLKPGALLINTARGGLVDEAALAHALRAGTLGGAAFDVLSKEPPEPDNPLLQLAQSGEAPHFILTPHVAWASSGAMQTLADMMVDNIEAFVRGAPINRLA